MTLSAVYDDQNIFAKIIAGDIPAAKIHEDDDTLAFMDAFPQSEGHCLVISKQERAVNLLDISGDALAHLIKRTQIISNAVVKSLQPDGFRIVQFNGSPAGQTVFHLHFHIIPVWEGRALGAHGGGQAAMDDLQHLAEKIRAEL